MTQIPDQEQQLEGQPEGQRNVLLEVMGCDHGQGRRGVQDCGGSSRKRAPQVTPHAVEQAYRGYAEDSDGRPGGHEGMNAKRPPGMEKGITEEQHKVGVIEAGRDVPASEVDRRNSLDHLIGMVVQR